MAPVKGPCEAPGGCGKPGLLYEYENVLGRRVRYFLCKAHADQLRNPEQREEMLNRVLAARDAVGQAAGQINENAVPAEDLADHDVQQALLGHQERCEPCRAVRDWIAAEVLAGRVRTPEDTRRIGEEAMRRCCPVGIYLQERLGQIMAGLRKP